MNLKITNIFLDINITNNTTNRKYKFKVHRKDAITNIHIKPNSSIDPSITKSVFIGILHRAHTICSGRYIKEETQFSVNMFVENEHKRAFLQALVKEYSIKNKNSHNRNDTNRKSQIGPKIRKEFKKVNKDITFTSGKNLKSILCQNNPNLLPNSYPGVYQLDCSCNDRYIGVSKKKY